VMLKLITT
jgi:hypothetical protein